VLANQVVREAVELLAYPLRVDNVEVIFDLAESLPTIWADPHRRHQVVVNLISNAHQAMREAPPSRRLIVVTREGPEPGWVRLEVTDTGPGIPPEVRQKIFEPFFTTKPLGQGTGLGLSLCQGIVESHGRRIQVESEPGHGARFIIDVPIGSALEPEAGPAAMAPAEVIPRQTILVVDDEPDIASLLADILSTDGHTVETAANGTEALNRLARTTYGVIISDLRMPGLDGPGLYRGIERAHPALVPRVVFVMGDTLSPEIQGFLARTAAPTLDKPFNPRDVRAMVGRVLARQQD
jgi:two-component system NtrC family sensor kinase